LDAELADIEEEQPTIEFLPEIEKKLAAFPSLLETSALSPSQGQMILYKPISFSEEIHNERRKEIIRARKREREEEAKKRAQEAAQSDEIDLDDQDTTTMAAQIPDDDPDAMDIG